MMVLWSILDRPARHDRPALAPMRVSHVTTTEMSARQFTLATIVGQPANTWTRRLDDGVELDGAVFEVADARTALHHIYVVHVLSRAPH